MSPLNRRAFLGALAVLNVIRYRLALLRWHLALPYRLGDPLLGSGDVRVQNRRLLHDRHDARKPKPESFGLLH